MTIRDQNTVELARQAIRIADDVVFWPVKERGEVTYRLEIPSLHRFFRVGYEEYVLISLLDGTTSIPQACGLAAATLGRRAPSGKQAEAIQRWLLKNELAYLPDQGAPIRRPNAGVNRGGNELGLLQRFNPFWVKLPMKPLAQRLQSLAGKLGWALSVPATLVAVALMLFASFTLLSHWDHFANETSEVFSGSNFVWLLASWVILKVIHESAHAIACHRFGGEIKDVGVVLVLFAPLAYVDVSSCWRMNSRWARMIVAAAGMYAEFLFACAALIVWRYTESPEVATLMRNVVVLASLTTVLFNANVLMRFDGYYILADAIDVSNLHVESTAAVKRAVLRFLTGRQVDGGNLIGWRRHFVLAYGFAAILWKAVVCFTLGVAASTLFSGAGIALTFIGILVWVGIPAQKLVRYSQDLWHQDRTCFTRAATLSGVTIAGVAMLVVWFPIPTAVTSGAVSGYKPETILRSGTDGFVHRVHVENMSRVSVGDLLIELENPELSDRMRVLEIEIAQNEIRKRQAANDRDASAVSVLHAKHLALTEQLAHVNSQRENLRVVAHRDGQVVARDLRQRLGTYVSEGERLMNIATDTEKELVAVVSQAGIRQARKSTHREVRLSAADFSTLVGTLSGIDPRATTRLPNPSLAASAGGPLTVRRDEKESATGEESMSLLDPHFIARISLEPETAARIPAGMRMRASFGYRNDSLLTRTRIAMSEFFYREQDRSTANR